MLAAVWLLLLVLRALRARLAARAPAAVVPPPLELPVDG
jgi:hypothetical protein